MSGAAATDTRDLSAGDRRIAELTAFRPLASVLMLTLPSLFLAWRVITFGTAHPVIGDCIDSPTDFCVFWDAAKLAIAGDGGSVFDQTLLRSTASNVEADWFPWLHPPATLLLFSPLGTLPAAWSWALFSGLSLLCFGAALSLILGRTRTIWFEFWLTPAIFPALILGQFTILWLAGLLAAFEALRRDRFVLAGVLIGLLTLKPTLGLLIPVALLAFGAWRTIFAAIVTTVVIQGGATLVFGFDYWPAMAEIYHEHTLRLLQQLATLDRMASLPALLSQMGLSGSILLSAQSVLTLALVALVAWIWKARDVSFDARMACLCAAIPLATPYLWYYDAALATLSALYLFRSGALPTVGYGRALYFLFWLGAGLFMWVRLVSTSVVIPATALVLPLALLALALAASRSRMGEAT
ncbi:glycosyltransferase family 87 protein [Actibacterium pelagium]|uniref:DUF2029 domain-containing protein n=1 Tax=Actibacterium pelagium TaxID=2029103 RepID=A0A917AC06_9RHOB|nr:glycosyltransferase family 87 protein [Actibacterium pelagium]GGE41629.1 hypothetical protein GCM10011517_06560 [Actibacterium pelagium]